MDVPILVPYEKITVTYDALHSGSGCGSYPILSYGEDDGKAYEAVVLCILVLYVIFT